VKNPGSDNRSITKSDKLFKAFAEDDCGDFGDHSWTL